MNLACDGLSLLWRQVVRQADKIEPGFYNSAISGAHAAGH